MVIADIYYGPAFQKFLRDGSYGHEKYAWAVNFMKMVADAFADGNGKARLKLSDKNIVTLKAADLSWANTLTQSFIIRYVADDDTVYYHAVEVLAALSAIDKPSPIFRAFIKAATAYNETIPLADDMDRNIENIYADGIERVVSERMLRSTETITALEKNIEELNVAAVQTSKRFSETIALITTEYSTRVEKMEAAIRRLRDDNIGLEKRLLTATKMYRDKMRLSGWYVYEIDRSRVSVDLRLRGGSLTETEVAEVSSDDVYYVTNDADDRYEADYVSISATNGVDHLDIVERVTMVTVSVRRMPCEGAIIRISDTSYIMTHTPKIMSKATMVKG